MGTAADYDWLFPRARFSRQARILETQLLYCGGLSAKWRPESGLREWTSPTPSAPSPRLKSAYDDPTSSPVRELVRMPLQRVPMADRQRSPRGPDDSLLVGKLQRELRRKEREAFEASQELQKESLEAVRLRGWNEELARQLERTLGRIGQMEAQMGLQEKQLASKERILSELNQFLQSTSERQAQAREALKDHVERLLERAETAETEVSTLRSSVGPASRVPSRLLPESSSNTMQSDKSHELWRNGLSPGETFPRGPSGLANGMLPLTDRSWPATIGTGPTDGSWSSPHPQAMQASPRQVQPQMLNPRSQPESHPSRSHPALSDLDRRYPHRRPELGTTDSSRPLSTDPGQESSALSYPPGAPVTLARVPQEQTARNPCPSRDRFLSSSEDPLQSWAPLGKEIVERSTGGAIEPTVQPSTDSGLLQASPTPPTTGGSQGQPVVGARPWDLNFLTEVMEDVLEKRDARKGREDTPARAGHQLQPGQMRAPVPGAHHPASPLDGPTPSPRMRDAPQSSANDYWTSSDDDNDISDGGTPDELESDDSQPNQTERLKTERLPGHDRSWQSAWLAVFAHLDTAALLTCAQVCKEWRVISKHPSLWATVRLKNRRISSKFLQTLCQWCGGLEHLHLEGLKPRSRLPGETPEKYSKNTWGSLEPGLEYVLISAGASLITLKIADCSNILTERSLFLASCYCRNLYSLTYVSQTNPIGHEVIWALGAGCRNLASLKVPPRQPCQHRQRLSNRCLQMIGRCWPLLLALSIGGPSIDGQGLVSVANNCPRLQVLELDHLLEVTEAIAVAMCRAGLRGLHTLILRGTLIAPAAVLHFNGACPQLKSLSVYLSPSVCRGDNRDFHNVVSQLRSLTRRRVLADVLHVSAKYN